VRRVVMCRQPLAVVATLLAPLASSAAHRDPLLYFGGVE